MFSTSKEITLKQDVLMNKNSKSDKSGTSLSEELLRFVCINLICILTIILIMTSCYIAHVLYGSFWKPFIKNRSNKKEKQIMESVSINHKSNKESKSVKNEISNDKNLDEVINLV